jgi:D-apiose dehydrogenase
MTAERPQKVRRVALAGAGMISWFHLIAWRKVPGIELVAIADPDLDRAGERASEFAIPAIYPDLAALLAAESVDAVDIATPRETHAALVRLAADHGIAALCQKPVATDWGEAERLAADVAGRVRVMVHENWRFRPAYRRIHRWMEETRPGRFLQGRISVQGSGLLADAKGRYPALERQPFFRTEKRLLIAESLIHHIDVARWLLGTLGLVGVRALHTSGLVPGETCATILLQTQKGAPVTIEGNMTVPGAPGRAGDDVSLIFERGAVRFCDNHLSFAGAAPETVAFDAAETYQVSFDAAIAHFVEALRKGCPFETDMQDNLETLRLVEDAYRAADPVPSLA